MIQIVLLALLPLAFAQYGGHGGGEGGYGGYGYEPKYSPQPYKFGYDVKDGYGSGLNQKEEGDAHGNKVGSYGYTDGYGIYRQVDYVADAHGFRATVKTNEPGTANQDPADVYIQSSAAPAAYAGAPAKAQSYGVASYAPAVSSYGGGYGGASLGLSLGGGYGGASLGGGYGGAILGGGHGGLSLGGSSYGPALSYAQSYSAPVIAAPKLSYGGSGYGIPNVGYAKGY